MQPTMQAANPAVIACKVCGLVHEIPPLSQGTAAKCTRCDSIITRRTAGSFHLTGAFALAALILYVPANIFPILRLEMYGAVSENTVWDGCVRLYQSGDFIIAVVVFLASILIPALKLLGLLILVVSTRMHVGKWKLQRTWLYLIIDAIGRWAMLDVFVLAVLVSLVKLQRLATVIPGKGLFAFTCVVVLTIFASQSFDPQLIWEKEEEDQ